MGAGWPLLGGEGEKIRGKEEACGGIQVIWLLGEERKREDSRKMEKRKVKRKEKEKKGKRKCKL